MKNYDYKRKMNRNRKRWVKRAVGISTAAALVVAPVAPNVLSNEGFGQAFGTIVAHAQTQNLALFSSYHFPNDNELRFFHNEYDQTTQHKVGVHVNIPNNTDYDNLVFSIKIPDEFAQYLEDGEYLEDTMLYSGFYSSFLDENDDWADPTYDLDQFMQYNAETQTIEMYLSDYMEAHNVRLDNRYSDPGALFTLTLHTDYKGIANGDYRFHMALTEGAADPTTVDGAIVYDFNVNYHEDGEEPTPEPEEPEQPEEPAPEPEEPEQPEEPAPEPEEPEQPEEPTPEPEEPEQPEEPTPEPEEPEQPEEPAPEPEEPEQPEEPTPEPEEPGNDDQDDQSGEEDQVGEDDNSGDDTQDDQDDNSGDDGQDDQDDQSDEDVVITENKKSDSDTEGTTDTSSKETVSSTEDSDSDDDEKLPETATNTWTYGLAGALALLAGGAVKLMNRFRREN